jgi:hypothetical protein
MDKLPITTPALLFSAVSLILLAYTNRFLGYAQLIRNLYSEYMKNKSHVLIGQIQNLRKRLYLTRAMQILGVLSLFFSVVSMLFIYIDLNVVASWIFGFGLLCLIASLALSVWEIQISVGALDLHLKGMEEGAKENIQNTVESKEN